MHMNKKSRTRSEAIDSIELIREVNSLDNDFQCLKRSIDDAVKVYTSQIKLMMGRVPEKLELFFWLPDPSLIFNIGQ